MSSTATTTSTTTAPTGTTATASQARAQDDSFTNTANEQATFSTQRTITNTAGYAETLGTTSTGSYNTALDSQIGPLDTQITELTASGANPTLLASLTDQRDKLNTERWQSLEGDNSPASVALSQAINAGEITWAQLGANVDISVAKNPAALMAAVTSLVAQNKANTASSQASTPSSTSQTNTDSTAAVNQTVADLTNTAAISSYIAANGGASVQAADQTQLQNLAGGASVGTALAASEGGANAARGVGQSAANATAEYGITRQNLATTNSTAVESYIASTFSNDVSNSSALANMSTQDRLNVQGAAADALVTSIQKSIGTGDANAQAQLNQLQQAINAWQTAEAGSEQQTSLWSKIGTIAAGVLMAGAGAVASAYGGGAIGVPLAAAGIGEIAKGV